MGFFHFKFTYCNRPFLTPAIFYFDGWWWWWMVVVVVDGHELSKKNMFFENISKTTRYFFLTVSRPLRRGFRTSFVKISKKVKKIKFWKKFRTIFFFSDFSDFLRSVLGVIWSIFLGSVLVVFWKKTISDNFLRKKYFFYLVFFLPPLFFYPHFFLPPIFFTPNFFTTIFFTPTFFFPRFFYPHFFTPSFFYPHFFFTLFFYWNKAVPTLMWHLIECPSAKCTSRVALPLRLDREAI